VTTSGHIRLEDVDRLHRGSRALASLARATLYAKRSGRSAVRMASDWDAHDVALLLPV
jgi:hypothetical protein